MPPQQLRSFWPATLPKAGNILEVGLYRQTGIDLEGIGDLDQRLVIARNRLAQIDIEGRDPIGDVGIGKAYGERVVGSTPEIFQ